MPGVVQRLLIWAAVDGIVLQAHGPAEHHKAIHIDYKTHRIKQYTSEDLGSKKEAQLEAHGIIGLLSIASFSFLLAITSREQVAQIFGKPIYVVTDIAVLPLSAQEEATQTIVAAAATAAASSRRSSDGSTDASDLSDSDADDEPPLQSPEDDDPPSPSKDRPLQRQGSSSTSVAEDVIARRGQYGRFAAEWFSKQGWGTGRVSGADDTSSDRRERAGGREPIVVHGEDEPQDSGSEPANASEQSRHLEATEPSPDGFIKSALPRILRSTKLILTSRSFFFSYDFDLTRRFALLKGSSPAPSKEGLDPLYFWNRSLGLTFLESRQEAFLVPIVQGFVGQRSFVASKSGAKESASASVEPLPQEGQPDAVNRAPVGLATVSDKSQSYLLTLISRRSTKRSGLRYLRRGIDDEGNCANAVETEQILSSPDWDKVRLIRSFVQIRASIPLYFSQSPYSLKPIPVLHQSASQNEAVFKSHFQDLQRRYGGVQIAMLVDKQGGEAIIGEAYESTTKKLVDSKELDDVGFEWFDFHHECRGMKFENVERLVQKLEKKLTTYGETVISKTGIDREQSGVVRTNCMDCLDRTNVVESAFGQWILQRDLRDDGFEIDLLHDESTTWFNTLWADNGDAISRQYASTAALKGDFTRTRRRNYRGALNDFSLTLSRFFNNMVNDYFSQAVIDVLLGNMSWKAFEDFENTMMTADPGISIEKVRQTAIDNCAKQVIQDEGEDLIHGWTMLAPAQENTLRTLPFEEAVVLLTDAALYCCKFDGTTEKLASFEKVDLRSISKIRFGTYITSTFTERQMNEELNAGLVVVYQPGKESVIRTNTGSLQNYVPSKTDGEQNRIDGGTGILSWLAPRLGPPSRALAIKVIPASTDGHGTGQKQSEAPLAVAEHIADEIRRAIMGSPDRGQPSGLDLVEKEAIISLAEAKKRTGYLEQIGHSIKKFVWT